MVGIGLDHMGCRVILLLSYLTPLLLPFLFLVFPLLWVYRCICPDSLEDFSFGDGHRVVFLIYYNDKNKGHQDFEFIIA